MVSRLLDEDKDILFLQTFNNKQIFSYSYIILWLATYLLLNQYL